MKLWTMQQSTFSCLVDVTPNTQADAIGNVKRATVFQFLKFIHEELNQLATFM